MTYQKELKVQLSEMSRRGEALLKTRLGAIGEAKRAQALAEKEVASSDEEREG